MYIRIHVVLLLCCPPSLLAFSPSTCYFLQNQCTFLFNEHVNQFHKLSYEPLSLLPRLLGSIPLIRILDYFILKRMNVLVFYKRNKVCYHKGRKKNSRTEEFEWAVFIFHIIQ